jgi:hypothetical protein
MARHKSSVYKPIDAMWKVTMLLFAGIFGSRRIEFHKSLKPRPPSGW